MTAGGSRRCDRSAWEAWLATLDGTTRLAMGRGHGTGGRTPLLIPWGGGECPPPSSPPACSRCCRSTRRGPRTRPGPRAAAMRWMRWPSATRHRRVTLARGTRRGGSGRRRAVARSGRAVARQRQRAAQLRGRGGGHRLAVPGAAGLAARSGDPRCGAGCAAAGSGGSPLLPRRDCNGPAHFEQSLNPAMMVV